MAECTLRDKLMGALTSNPSNSVCADCGKESELSAISNDQLLH